ncbi:MAG: geranylgeranyl reductase family protein [Thermoplasmatota archaeon]
MIKYDVVIIGAGPAGSYLAYKLKNQGLDVLVLEKQKFPRYKVCAGGLSKKAYDILFSENKKIENIVEKKVSKGLYVRGNRFKVTEPGKELIYMTYRSELDNFLVKMAMDNKTVCFKDNVFIKKINEKENSITYVESNNEYSIKYVILVGAWGANIKLNKLVGLVPFERFSVSSSWEGPPGKRFSEYFDEFALTQIMRKYPGFVGYIFPKSELVTAGLFTSMNPSSYILQEMWKEFVRFWGLDDTIKPRYAWISIRDFKKPIAKKNVMLVGDAAGLADPFTGEGIYYAFINSGLASIHIQNFFKNRNYNLANEYNKSVNLKLFDVHKWAKFYESMFHRFPNLSFWFGSETSLGNDIVNSFITGEIKYNEVKKIIKLVGTRILGKKKIKVLPIWDCLG